MQQFRSILIPDGEDELALRVLRCLAEVKGFRVSILSSKRRAPIRYSRYHHRYITHTAADFDCDRIDAIKEAALQVNADTILPAGLRGIRFAAEHFSEISSIARLPPMPAPQLLNAFADKLLFSELLEREQIPYPKILRPQGGKIDQYSLASITFPVLVKPRNLDAGKGIQLCNTRHEVNEFFKYESNPYNYYVQEFIKGPDISCSVLAQEGEILAYTMQRGVIPSPQPFKSPAVIEFIHDEGVLSSIRKLIRSVLWSGIVNIDLVWDEKTNEAKVLESNPRYWRSLLGSLTAGVNFPHLACLASDGRTFPRPEYREGVRYAKPDLAVDLMLRKCMGESIAVSGLNETGLQFLVKDPLPDFAIQFSRLARNVFSIAGTPVSSLRGLLS